jgi:hypothetical protein
MIVWKLLCRYAPGFDPAKTINIRKPWWGDNDGNVIQFDMGFGPLLWLCAKRGNYHRLVFILCATEDIKIF